MPGSKLKLTIRRNQILQQLHKTGKVTVTQLSADLGTTQVTIRSDLAAMEREGLLLRVQGGAVPAANAGPLPGCGASGNCQLGTGEFGKIY